MDDRMLMTGWLQQLTFLLAVTFATGTKQCISESAYCVSSFNQSHIIPCSHRGRLPHPGNVTLYLRCHGPGYAACVCTCLEEPGCYNQATGTCTFNYLDPEVPCSSSQSMGGKDVHAESWSRRKDTELIPIPDTDVIEKFNDNGIGLFAVQDMEALDINGILSDTNEFDDNEMLADRDMDVLDYIKRIDLLTDQDMDEEPDIVQMFRAWNVLYDMDQAPPDVPNDSDKNTEKVRHFDSFNRHAKSKKLRNKHVERDSPLSNGYKTTEFFRAKGQRVPKTHSPHEKSWLTTHRKRKHGPTSNDDDDTNIHIRPDTNKLKLANSRAQASMINAVPQVAVPDQANSDAMVINQVKTRPGSANFLRDNLAFPTWAIALGVLVVVVAAVSMILVFY